MDHQERQPVGSSSSVLLTESNSSVSKKSKTSVSDAPQSIHEPGALHQDDSVSARHSFLPNIGSSTITWDKEDDPSNPRNFSGKIKCTIAFVIGMMNLTVSLAVSLFTGFLPQAGLEFNQGEERMQWGVSVYILGLAFGPLFFGPASEFYGRRLPLLSGMGGFMVFTVFVTFARDFGGVLACRFLAGVCGSAAYVIPPGVFVDIFGPVGRAVGYQIFATGAFVGGSLGPGIGASIAAKGDWRGSMWLLNAVTFPLVALMAFLPETLEAVILHRKSRRLREETGDWTLRSTRDERPVRLNTYLLKPWQMLIREPVLMAVTTAFTLDYGIQSLTYSEIPYAFQMRGWKLIDSSWALAITISGFMLGCGATTMDTKLRFQRQLSRGRLVIPENRLPPMILGMAILSAGLVWFGQASASLLHVPWICLALAEAVIGVGMYMVWVTATVYVQDLYVSHSNSALAACAFVRYSSGAAFPLLAKPMRAMIGVSRAVSCLGFMCAILVPLHFLFYFYGKQIRGWSRYALHES